MGESTSRVGALTPERQRLLDKLLGRDAADGQEIRIPRRDGDRSTAPLSFGQERLFVVEQTQPDSLMFVGTGAVRLRGDIDVAQLRQAIALLAERHEALRTAIVESPETGAVIQRILPVPQARVEMPVREVERSALRSAVADAAAQPFDLGRPPLLRPLLLRVSDAPAPEWVLVLSMHHIVIDAWSIGVLMREVGEVYGIIAEGQRPALPELEISYGDFAAWQRRQLARGELQSQLAHWRDRLGGVPMVDVPTDRPRPARRNYAGDTVALALGEDVVAALRAVTDSANATLFMALVAGWAIVLNRWSGTDDIVVGTPVAGRGRSELENVVGFFVNTLPLRVRVDPQEDFRTVLHRVRETCVDAFAHQDVPFERIVGELPLDRDASGQTTLARHWLALNNNVWKADWRGVEVEVLPDLVGTVRCDLSVQLSPAQAGGLDGHLEFSTELFDTGTATRLASAFTAILCAASAAPDSAIAALTKETEQAALAAMPGAVPPVDPGYPDVVRWFEAQADATPGAVAVIADEPDEVMRFAELDRRANRIAHLLANRGVGPEDVVGLHLDRCADLAAAMLGTFKAGAVFMPIAPDLPKRRLDRLIEIARPRQVLIGQGHGAITEQAVELTDDLLAEQPDTRPPSQPLASGAAAFLLFTSGSTGAPKGVLGTHGGLLNRLAGMQDSYRLTAADRVLSKAAVGFDVSLWEVLLPLVTGAAVVLARPDGHRDIAYLHQLIAARDVTICHFVPSLLEEFVRADGPTVPRLRLLLSGGERLSRQLAERVIGRWPHVRFVNQYGPTETVIDVTAADVTAPVPDVVSIGRPVPGTELIVLDQAGQPLPVGVPGELHVAGVQVARCYVGSPGETARRFVPHPGRAGLRLYATGDRVRWLADGSLDFLGRIDGQVKIRGNRIEPGEVEVAARNCPAVADVLVRTRSTDAGQPQLVAYVIAAGAPAALPSELSAFLAERLPQAAVPSHVVVIDRWPVNANGKIDIAALPEPADGLGPGEEYEPPRGDVEKQLAEIWAELLEVDRVGRTASFAALGGHSLIAIRAVGRIKATFGVRIKIGEFFNAADLASLAALIEGRIGDGDPDTDEDAPIPRINRG